MFLKVMLPHSRDLCKNTAATAGSAGVGILPSAAPKELIKHGPNTIHQKRILVTGIPAYNLTIRVQP